MKVKSYWFILRGTKDFKKTLAEKGLATDLTCMIEVKKSSRTPLALALRNQAQKQFKQAGFK
jgi:hypothetical protein